MNLRQVVRTVRTHWVVALATFLVCVLIGAAYAVVPAKQYEATVVLLAQPPAGPNAGSDVAAIQIEIPQIAVEAENASVDAEIRTQVPKAFQSVPVTITATGDPSSNTVTINAKSTDPAAAQAYANATAAQVLRVTNRDAGSLLVLSELGVATLPTAPSNPRTTVAAAAIALGLIAAVFAALAARAFRRFVVADEIWTGWASLCWERCPRCPVPRGSGRHVPIGRRRAWLEAFQQLRSHLHVMFHETHPVIAFTSCDPREGKSTVVSHAAWALATSGQFRGCRRRRPASTETARDLRGGAVARRE